MDSGHLRATKVLWKRDRIALGRFVLLNEYTEPAESQTVHTERRSKLHCSQRATIPAEAACVTQCAKRDVRHGRWLVFTANEGGAEGVSVWRAEERRGGEEDWTAPTQGTRHCMKRLRPTLG